MLSVSESSMACLTGLLMQVVFDIDDARSVRQLAGRVVDAGLRRQNGGKIILALL